MLRYGFSNCFQKANNRLYHFALGFVILFFLSGCQSAELRALENSTTIIQLTTGREVSRWHQDKGTTFGKPDYPEVRIEYEPIANYTVEKVYDEIVATLEKNNWQKVKLGIPYPGFYRAISIQDDLIILAEVKIQSEKKKVSILFRNRPP